jgi:5,6-dimethylbenzimidazole synthase
MPVQLLEIHEGQDYGYTTAVFHYISKTPEGGRYLLDSYFTLIFHKENGLWKVVADICTPISRTYTEVNPDIRYSSDQRYLLDTIKNRRTVRRFKPTPVPKEHLMKILNAAHDAPTAGNQQPWKFLVVQDRKRLDELRRQALGWYIEAYRQKPQADTGKLESIRESTRKALEGALSAPVYIAILVDTQAKYPEWIAYDGTLAAGSLMIAARALGYGTGFYTTFFPESGMKAFFRIPDRYKLICFTPVGVPEEWPQPPAKKPLADLVVFEKFQ